jgi:hypothetical protein
MSIIETKKLNYYYQDGDMQRYILRDISVSFEKDNSIRLLANPVLVKQLF